MKQFFKMMFASTAGVLIAIGIIFLISSFVFIGLVASMGSSTSYNPSLNTVYKITLNGSLTDSGTDNPFSALFGNTEKSMSMKGLLESIKDAKESNNVKGIYLEAGIMSMSAANAQALRRALLDFKESGKFIVAYGDNYLQGNYYLCSVADEVFLNPLGILELTGLASQTMFYTGLLEKAGVEMEVFKVGTYKGAVEPFMLNKLSDENREQIQSYLNSVWNNMSNGIAEARNIPVHTVNDFANQGLFFSTPDKAVGYGLITGLKYKDEAEHYVKELAGQSGTKLKTADYEKMTNIKKKVSIKANEIAVVYAEGEITDESVGSIYDAGSKITQKAANELKKLRTDDNVKAVVLRVNSPGGSMYVSEQIWQQVVELKKVKPVVVSMGSTAASGGYYISCAADRIIAENNTLTGSIGVFSIFPNLTGTFKKLDVTSDVVKTNTYADIGNMARPVRDDERAIIQAYTDKAYDLFLTRCADGRKMTKDEINAIGQGRVWTGEQAKEIGLVDELGGIEKAIEVAAGLADIGDYSVRTISGKSDFFQDFIEKQLGEAKLSVVKEFLSSDYEYIQLLNRIRTTSGVQARLPYDVKPL